MRGIKFIALLALTATLALGLTTICCAQAVGPNPGYSYSILGVWPGSSTADPARTSAGPAKGPEPSFSSVTLGPWPGSSMADPARTSAGKPTGPEPSYSTVVLGAWPGSSMADPAKTTLAPSAPGK